MVYITGDVHAEFNKFSTKNFPRQKEMSRDDYIIVCGDFGIWHDCPSERYWLKWLAKKPFTLLFVDGNHENFDRLNNEFPVVDFHGGKAHKIRDNVYHLMRGYVFDLCEKKFFAFGGASSHDIQDGILYLEDYPSRKALLDDYSRRTRNGQMLRINKISWWKGELPTEEEMQRGRDNLEKVSYKVDYVISHCLPQSMVVHLCGGGTDSDVVTRYFEKLVQDGLQFKQWYVGHYHKDTRLLGNYNIFYHKIERIL